MKRDDVKNLVGVGKVFVLLPVALASVTLAAVVGLSNKGWTRLQTRLYAGRRRHSSYSTPHATTSTEAIRHCRTRRGHPAPEYRETQRLIDCAVSMLKETF